MSAQHLSPSKCGALLGVSGEFIRGEIKDGRLVARKHTRASGRTAYRIDPEDFRSYVETHWPKVSLERSA